MPEIHAELVRRGVPICARSVSNLLDRYDELLALSCSDAARLRQITQGAGEVILAIDGLQPDVGHEVLWALRDVLSGEVLLARSLLSSTRDDLAKLIGEVRAAVSVPIIGVVSDGQALSEALAWSARLSQTAGNAVASVKNLVEHARSRSLREQLDAEREQFTANLQHDNAAEGLRAFFEKCKPRFS